MSIRWMYELILILQLKTKKRHFLFQFWKEIFQKSINLNIFQKTKAKPIQRKICKPVFSRQKNIVFFNNFKIIRKANNRKKNNHKKITQAEKIIPCYGEIQIVAIASLTNTSFAY